MTSPPAHGDGRTIFLVDGWSAFRRSLRLFVEAAGYRIVGEADTVAEAATQLGLGAADVVILDPGGEWPDVQSDLATLRRVNPSAAIVVLTAERLDAEAESKAHVAGVDALLTKLASPDEILATLAIALCGNLIVVARSDPARRERPQLTRREHEILALVAEGFTDRIIGDTLWVAEQTVQFHLANVLHKLGVANRAAAVQRARGFGLLARWEQWPDLPPAGGGQPA